MVGWFFLLFDWVLAGDDGNANVLYEFNDLLMVKYLDVSLWMDYYVSVKNGNLWRLVMCDVVVG